MATKDNMTRISNFHGGMGNDEFLLGEGQYVYAENIDIYRDPRYIQLAPLPVEYDRNVTNGTVATLPTLVFFYSGGDAGVFYFLDDKSIQKKNGTIVYVNSTRPKASFGPWVMYKRIDRGLYFADNNVFRMALVVTSGTESPWEVTTGGLWEANKLENSAVTSSNNHPVVDQATLWYIGGGDVFRIESNGPDGASGLPDFTETNLNVATYGGFSDIQLQSDTIWGTSTSMIGNKTLISSFDAAGNVGQTKVMQQQVIQGYNKDGQLFLVTGSVSSLTGTTIPLFSAIDFDCIQMYANYGFGANGQQLLTRSRISNWITKGFSSNSQGLVFYFYSEFGVTNHNWFTSNGITYTIQSKNDEAFIYAYGKAIGATRDAFTVILSKNSAGKKLRRIGGLFQDTSTANSKIDHFYYSYEDEDGVCGVDDFYNYMGLEEPPAYQPEGKILLRVDDGGDFGMKKEIKGNVIVGCDVPTGTSIVISYVLDDGTETEYFSISPTTQGSAGIKKVEISKPIRGFQSIAWYITLNGGAATPKLYNFNYELGGIQP